MVHIKKKKKSVIRQPFTLPACRVSLDTLFQPNLPSFLSTSLLLPLGSALLCPALPSTRSTLARGSFVPLHLLPPTLLVCHFSL